MAAEFDVWSCYAHNSNCPIQAYDIPEIGNWHMEETLVDDFKT